MRVKPLFTTLLVLLVGLSQGWSLSAHAADDPGSITMSAGGVKFLVSEGNLRKIEFYASGADFVQLGPPMANNQPVPGIIAVFDSTKTTPFKFSADFLPVSASRPLVLYILGMKATALDAVCFEYRYFKTGEDAPFGSGTGTLTVVKASMTFTGPLAERNEKLLAEGKTFASVTVAPPLPGLTTAWTYDNTNTATVAPLPGRPLAAKVTAGADYTDPMFPGIDELHCTLKGGVRLGDIDFSRALDITAPCTVTVAAMPRPQNNTVNTDGILSDATAAAATFHLFRWFVHYPVLDQFGDNIAQSEWGGAVVQVREDVAIHSPRATLSDLDTYWANSTTTPNWKTIKVSSGVGYFIDHIEESSPDDQEATSKVGAGIPMNLITQKDPAAKAKTYQFIPRTAHQEVATIHHHIWHVSIGYKDAQGHAAALFDTSVTDNELLVEVLTPPNATQTAENGYETETFRATYTITLTP